MKLWKLLTVPVVLLLSMAFAVTASAHNFSDVTVTPSCNTDTGRICIDVKGNIAPGNDARTIIFQLTGVKGGTGTDLQGETVQIDLPANITQPGAEPKDVAFDSGKICFPAVTGTFDSFDVKYEGTVSGDLTLTINDKDVQKGDVVVKGIQPCTEATPVPSPPASPGTGQGGGQPSVSPSVAAAVALAQTGGFDFRLPIVGLTVLVAGLGILLVSASRGRRSTSR